MPLPEPSEQEGKSVEAGTDAIPVDPEKPQDFNLILLTVSNEDGAGAGSKPMEVHCVVSLEASEPTALAGTLQIVPAEEQPLAVQPRKRPSVQPHLRALVQKRSRLDTAPTKPLEFLRTPFGGRLLVLESFLYKQEKAVGDKVYWKCRQHAGLGCRGRAITRGLRATVMRDHCHPPDEEALAARRQKEKLPGAAPPDGLGDPQAAQGPGDQGQEPLKEASLRLCPADPEPAPQQVQSQPAPQEERDPAPLSILSLPPKKRSRLRMGLPWGPPPRLASSLEFLKTCYGGSFLVHQSFLYKREKAVGDRVYWTCRDHALHGCRSRAITQGPRVTVMRPHCHPPDKEGLEARRQQEKTLGTLQARPAGPGGGVDQPRQGPGSPQGRGEPAAPAPTRPRRRKRAKAKGAPPAPGPKGHPQEDPSADLHFHGPEFLKTPLGGSFLVYESFLYRREKAAGDKVYWTCRDQARMGCRSRAITQGRRVTVMRGHCHPPDLLGLETMRQRERRPGPAPWENPDGPEFLKTPLGGSFLVYESFLYRREKAAGDKVYWTCRDQARMNCRSRAITQGERVMVMRRHCHPPDMAGLQALRQREHLPNLTHWEGPEPPEPLEFLKTPLGGRFLVYESFLYRKEKAAGEKVYWMCRDQARLGCRSRAITQGRRVMVMRRHCHPPDLAGLEALRQRERQGQEDPEKTKLPEDQPCIDTCSNQEH